MTKIRIHTKATHPVLWCTVASLHSNIDNIIMSSLGLAGAGCGEINAAKKSLAIAKKWEESTKDTLKIAREQLQDAEKKARDASDHVKEAELHLKNVEKKWEVVDLANDDNGSRRKRMRVDNATVRNSSDDGAPTSEEVCCRLLVVVLYYAIYPK